MESSGFFIFLPLSQHYGVAPNCEGYRKTAARARKIPCCNHIPRLHFPRYRVQSLHAKSATGILLPGQLDLEKIPDSGKMASSLFSARFIGQFLRILRMKLESCPLRK
jgi:hypothetical protein